MTKDQPIDREAIETGKIPWDEDELLEAIDHFHHLTQTPHDDWDRRRHEVTLVDQQGAPTETIQINPDHIGNQMNMFIRDRCRAADCDRTTTMSHMWRFMEVRYFVSENFDRLREDELIRPLEGEPEAVEISEALFRELAGAPYEGTKVHPRTREVELTFDYESVVLRAKAREASGD